jgi:hypothetical protein
MSRLSHSEIHMVHRIGWLGAAALEANDARPAGARGQAAIACISGLTPKRLIIRFILKASTCRLISVLTFSRVLVRKWVLPIQALSVLRTPRQGVHRPAKAKSGRSSLRANYLDVLRGFAAERLRRN